MAFFDSVVNAPLFWNAFWLVVGLTIGTWVTYYVYILKIPQDIAEETNRKTAEPYASEWESLIHAAFWAIYKSKWGKWHRGQKAYQDESNEDYLRHAMHAIATLVTDAAVEGRIEIRGRPKDEVEFEPISAAMWHLVALVAEPNKASIYSLRPIERGVVHRTGNIDGIQEAEPEPVRDNIRTREVRRVLSNDSFLVNFQQFQDFLEEIGPQDG